MATTKAESLPSGIIKLTKLLQHLSKPPKLTFTNNVRSLKLSLAYSNDHWGAAHFVKEDLPRIRYHNPDLKIDVIKWRKEKHEHWRPDLELKFDDGRVKFVEVDAKPSSTILKEVMSIAGGDPWKTHLEESIKAGMPIVPDEPRHHDQKKMLPNLWEFRKANPNKEQKFELARKEREERKAQKKRGDVGKPETKESEESTDTSSTLETAIPSTPSDSSTTATMS